MDRINDFFQELYRDFNDRHIDLVIANMTEGVKWANGIDGGYVYGHSGVREYWTRQFTMVSSKVTPLEILTENELVKIKVHQVVRDLSGTLLADEIVYHLFHLRNNKIAEFNIGESTALEKAEISSKPRHMIFHFIRIISIAAVILLIIFLPYLPGDYDAYSVSLSTMAQLLGFAGLLFIPVGIAWLIYELAVRRKKERKHSNTTHRFALATLIASGLVSLITSLGAVANNSLSLGIICLLGFALLILSAARKLKQLKNSADIHFNPVPFYLICIPVIIMLVRSIFIVPAIEFSRNYTIKQSEKYIRDIEAYYSKNGHYPVSLQSLWNDYNPHIRGVKQFHYEISGNAYNIYFEQFSNEIGVREIVMYNKLNEHEMTSHDTDLLQLTPEEQDRQRGYISTHTLPQANWKYFWFD